MALTSDVSATTLGEIVHHPRPAPSSARTAASTTDACVRSDTKSPPPVLCGDGRRTLPSTCCGVTPDGATYHFLKITTDDGVVGWSEFDENFGSPGVGAIVERLGERLIGHRVARHQEAIGRLYYATRPAAGGVIGEAIGAIENAMLDAHAADARRPVPRIARRPRSAIGSASTGVTRRPGGSPTPMHYGHRITDRHGSGRVRRRGGRARLRRLQDQHVPTAADGTATPDGCPGFGRPYAPGLVADRAVVAELGDQLAALREGAGDAADILLDLNFNLRGGEHLELVQVARRPRPVLDRDRRRQLRARWRRRGARAGTASPAARR